MNGMGDRQAKRLQSEQGDAVIHDDATATAAASEEEKEKEKETETEQEKANANAKQCRRCGKNESILHPMKVEGEYQQLCSTCILQTNPDMYCALCLRMMQQNNNSDGGAGEGEVFKCAKCMRRMHIACLNSVAASGGQQQQQQQEEEEEEEQEEEEASCALCRNPNCDPLQRQRQRQREKVKVKVKAKASGKASALVKVEPYVVVLAARISAVLLRRVAHSRAAEASNFAAEAVRKRNDAKDAINAAISNAISHQQHLMQQQQQQQQQILQQQPLPRDPDEEPQFLQQGCLLLLIDYHMEFEPSTRNVFEHIPVISIVLLEPLVPKLHNCIMKLVKQVDSIFSFRCPTPKFVLCTLIVYSV